MQIFSRILLLLTSALLFSACVRKDLAVTESDWIIDSIKTHADSAMVFSNPRDHFMLIFEGRGDRANIFFGTGSCFSEVVFKTNNRIEFKNLNCSVICCNPNVPPGGIHLSNSLPAIMEDVNLYTLNGNVLTMATDDNRIINFRKR